MQDKLLCEAEYAARDRELLRRAYLYSQRCDHPWPPCSSTNQGLQGKAVWRKYGHHRLRIGLYDEHRIPFDRWAYNLRRLGRLGLPLETDLWFSYPTTILMLAPLVPRTLQRGDTD